eukprot:snap_masked-scaffold_90-processed-gene-0.24-mRNA-1 protein AED:1.00 eAED:1.00 QI:0/0/0/0/1/1/2/0/191
MPISSKQALIMKYLVKWKYEKQHEEVCKKEKETKLQVYNLTYPYDVQQMLKYVSKVDADLSSCFPKYSGSRKDFCSFLRTLWSDLKKREKDISDAMNKLEDMVESGKNISKETEDFVVEQCKTPNLWKIDLKKLNCIRARNIGSFFSGDARDFLLHAEEKYDIVVVGPPWRVFSRDSIRGHAVTYTTMSDT